MKNHGISAKIRISQLLSKVDTKIRRHSKRNSLNLSLQTKADSSHSFHSKQQSTPKQVKSSRKRIEKSYQLPSSNKKTFSMSAKPSPKVNGNITTNQQHPSCRPSPRSKLSILRYRSVSNSYTDPDKNFSALVFPQKPTAILRQFASFLSRFEHSEILDYPEIYFIGLKASKIQGEESHMNSNNGFDDDRSDYRLVFGDHIAYRYEVIKALGKGSFGQVCKCFDHKTKTYVAVKMIRNQRHFHKQGSVEIKILEYMKDRNAPHVVEILDHFTFRNHMVLIFELLSLNLYDLMKNNSFHGFSLSLIKRFAVQLISCLVFLQKHKIVHCDLKPENVLLRQQNKSAISVIDFGSSCFEDEKLYTYIQSRFYRAPEVMMGIPYTTSIDMWSLGCLLGEMHSGYPLFPGESEAEQMQCIMEVKGVVPKNLIHRGTRANLFFETTGKPKVVSNSRGKVRVPASRSLADKVKSNDPLFLSFIEQCLQWDPEYRIKPDEALYHPWFKETNKFK